MRPAARGHPRLRLRRRPLPRPRPGERLEPAGQADPALDQRPAQPPRRLLPAPALQHRLKQRRLRPQRRRAIDQHQRRRARGSPSPSHSTPKAQASDATSKASDATGSDATFWHQMQRGRRTTRSPACRGPEPSGHRDAASTLRPRQQPFTRSDECCIRCNSAHLHNAHERVSQFPGNPLLAQARRTGDLAEAAPEVVLVEHGADARREHQAGVLPCRPRLQPVCCLCDLALAESIAFRPGRTLSRPRQCSDSCQPRSSMASSPCPRRLTEASAMGATVTPLAPRLAPRRPAKGPHIPSDLWAQ